MENKYFTPNIEDMCIGYEYEIFQKGKPYDPNVMHFMPQPEEDTWIKMIYPDAFLGYNLKRMFEIYQIRVPYLTKEQIEAERWEEMNAPIMSIGYGFLYIPFLKNNCRLDYNYTTNILNIKKDDVTNLYYGECKDINTFRKIIKLLGI